MIATVPNQTMVSAELDAGVADTFASIPRLLDADPDLIRAGQWLNVDCLLGPIGQPASIATAGHAHEHLDPVESARECAYDHAHQLIELLDAAGRQVTVQLDELSFAELERSR